MHLEVLTGMHQDFEKRTDERAAEHQEFQRQMTQYAADVKDAIRRLADIAEAHDTRLDDHQDRIEKLEGD